MPLDQLNRQELEDAYRLTDYVVEDEGAKFTIRLDGDNEALDHFLATRDIDRWAFLTAYNPFSKALPEDENVLRQSRLVSMLEQKGHRYFRARGVGDDWEEPSLFVLNIGREGAIEIAKQFEQNAILWGDRDGKAELIWCAP